MFWSGAYEPLRWQKSIQVPILCVLILKCQRVARFKAQIWKLLIWLPGPMTSRKVSSWAGFSSKTRRKAKVRRVMKKDLIVTP